MVRTQEMLELYISRRSSKGSCVKTCGNDINQTNTQLVRLIDYEIFSVQLIHEDNYLIEEALATESETTNLNQSLKYKN